MLLIENLKLQTNLIREFGLNPNHWIIHDISSERANLKHKEDHEIILELLFDFKNKPFYSAEIKLENF